MRGDKRLHNRPGGGEQWLPTERWLWKWRRADRFATYILGVELHMQSEVGEDDTSGDARDNFLQSILLGFLADTSYYIASRLFQRTAGLA